MSSHVSENPYLVQENGEWILVLERSFEHPVEDVWAALTKADQMSNWGPFTADRDLTAVGSVKLAQINAPEAGETEGDVLEVSPPHLLILRWGSDILRWELSREDDQTVLILRHRFANHQDAPSYAAGWHLCLKGLTGTLSGEEMPSMAGENAFKYGWKELYEQYSKQFGEK